jgi:hypothetical protein
MIWDDWETVLSENDEGGLEWRDSQINRKLVPRAKEKDGR